MINFSFKSIERLYKKKHTYHLSFVPYMIHDTVNGQTNSANIFISFKVNIWLKTFYS